MSRYYASDEERQQRPLTWLAGRPIYTAHAIIVVYVASMLVTAILMAFKADGFVFSWLPYTSGRVLQGEVWRVLTYGLVNPPTLTFVIDMFMIGWFGFELERCFGRAGFIRLFACLYLLPPVLFTLIGFWQPMALAGQCGAFALFIAFATLYPEMPVLFNLLAKWVAGVLVGIYSLMALAARDWTGLGTLWITAGFAFAFVRYEQGKFTLPRLTFWRRPPSFRVLPDLPKETVRAVTTTTVAPEASMAEIDALLDKIAQHGIGSLTAKERAKLEKGREKLLKKKSDRS